MKMQIDFTSFLINRKINIHINIINIVDIFTLIIIINFFDLLLLLFYNI